MPQMRTRVDIKSLVTEMTEKVGYSHIMVRLAMDNRARDPNVFCFGKIDFIDESGKEPDVTYDYGNFKLVRKTFPISHMKQLLIEIDSGIISVDALQVNLDKRDINYTYEFVPSQSTWHVIEADGPQHCIMVEAGSNESVPYDPLESRPGTPHYGTKIQAVMDFMELAQLSQFKSELIVVLHELRGRMNLEIEGKQLKGIIDGKAKDDELYVKFYCRKGDRHRDATTDIVVKNRVATYTTSFEPDKVHSILCYKPTNEILDEKELGGWSTRRGVIIKTPESALRQMIESGESKTVEFKSGIRTEDELLETIVSFANSEGGTILVGIADNKQVLGFYDDEERSEKSIMSRATGQCIPSMEPLLEWTEVEERPILVIKVPEGNDKPYTLRGKGGYIRRGKDDYPIERPELDKIYSEKNRGTGHSVSLNI